MSRVMQGDNAVQGKQEPHQARETSLSSQPGIHRAQVIVNLILLSWGHLLQAQRADTGDRKKSRHGWGLGCWRGQQKRAGIATLLHTKDFTVMVSFLPHPLPSFPLSPPHPPTHCNNRSNLLQLHQVTPIQLQTSWFPLNKLKSSRIQVVNMCMQEQLGAASGRVPGPCATPARALCHPSHPSGCLGFFVPPLSCLLLRTASLKVRCPSSDGLSQIEP